MADINGDNANKVADEIKKAGGKAIAIVADVTKAADLDMMFAKTTSTFGGASAAGAGRGRAQRMKLAKATAQYVLTLIMTLTPVSWGEEAPERRPTLWSDTAQRPSHQAP